MAKKRGYGIGLQWFPNIINRKCVYVDKTAIESYELVKVKE